MSTIKLSDMAAAEGASPTGRAPRALAIIAAALTTIVLASVLYLHPVASSPAPPLPRIPSIAILDSKYDATYDFVNPSSGWALVTEANPRTDHLTVYSTIDGAQHWQKRFSAPMPPGMATLHFFDAAHGMISILSDPSFVYETADGGDHWNVVSFPRSVVTFDFADPLHGWVETWLGRAGFGFRLFSTSDGGKSWIERNWPAAASWGTRARYGLEIQLRGNGEGWVGGYNARPTAYVTHDDGLTWQPVPIAMPARASAARSASSGQAYLSYTTEISLLSGQGVLAVVIDQSGSAHALVSSDSGNAWRLLDAPAAELQYSDYLFLDSTHWWAVHSGTVYKTDDAGLTWSRTRSPDLTDKWNYNPHLIDSRHAWAVLQWAGASSVGTALAMTSDGGLTWQGANVPKPG